MMDDKVIVINYTGRRGAGNLAAYEISKALTENGFKVIPIISSNIENIEMWKSVNFEKLVIVNTYNNKLSFLVNTLLFPVKTAPRIRKELKGVSIMAVYCPMLTLWSDRINSLFNNSKVIMAIHDPIPHSGTSGILKYFNRKRAIYDAVVVHSKVYVKQISKIRNTNEKVYYIPLGLLNVYRDIDNKKSIIEYDDSKTNFVFFGRIEKYKGLDILADAWQELQKKYQDKITLSIIGSGDFSPYIDKYKGFNNVRIINRWIYDEEVESVFVGDNLICVCPYRDGTQSGVILTALDYGVPSIATNTGGISEQVVDGETGKLISPNSVKELYDSMEEFIIDKDRLSVMKKEISNYKKYISWDKSAGELIKVIEDVS